MDRNFLEDQKQFFLETIFELQKLFKQPMFTETLNEGDQNDRFSNEREQAKIAQLRKRNWFFLKKVKKALRKIENGNYGVCEDCGDCIDEGRLKARPTAELCILCKEEQESTEFKQEEPGKVISFPNVAGNDDSYKKVELVH